MNESEIWHKTILELAKGGMKWPDCAKMADGIMESYLRRYPEKEPDNKLDPQKKPKDGDLIACNTFCPKCKSGKFSLNSEWSEYKYQCNGCENLYGHKKNG